MSGGTINIGNNISGGTIMSGNSTLSKSIMSIYSGTSNNINIGSNIINGIITIGNSIATIGNTYIYGNKTGTMNIGTNISGGINITGSSYSNSQSLSGSWKVDNLETTNLKWDISSTNISLYTTSIGTLNIARNNNILNINTCTQPSQAITIGNTTATTSSLSLNSGISGSIIINAPIKIGYDVSRITPPSQIGYYYLIAARGVSTNSISSQYSFCPLSTDHRHPVLLPAGVYSVTINGNSCSYVGKYGFVSGIRYVYGYVWSTSLPMTVGNTTKVALFHSNGVNDNSYTTAKTMNTTCSGIFTVSGSQVNSVYYAGYAQITTTGTIS